MQVFDDMVVCERSLQLALLMTVTNVRGQGASGLAKLTFPLL